MCVKGKRVISVRGREKMYLSRTNIDEKTHKQKEERKEKRVVTDDMQINPRK